MVGKHVHGLIQQPRPSDPARVIGMLGVDHSAEQRGEEIKFFGALDAEPSQPLAPTPDDLHRWCIGLSARYEPRIMRWFINWCRARSATE